MFIKKLYNQKSILIFKHLEIPFINNLNNKIYEQLSSKFIIGYYYGFHTESIPKYKPDFVISLDDVMGQSLRNHYKEIPIFKRSGFNYIPENIDDYVKKKSCHIKNEKLMYIGDLSPRKNLLDVIIFSNKFKLPFEVFLKINSSYEIMLIHLINFFSPNTIKINIPRTKKSFSRKTILKKMSESKAVFIPYKKEGAARVLAEAELICKPVIYNNKMIGGTLAFLKPEENIKLSNFNTMSQIDKLKSKKYEEKLIIYGCAENTKKFEEFIYHHFELKVIFQDQELVNAFSGHKNIINNQFTNKHSDEIKSFASFHNFLNSYEIDQGKPKFQINLNKYINETKKHIIKINYFLKVLSCLLISSK